MTANAWEGKERLAESVAALVGLAPAAFGVLSNRDHLLDELARRARAEGERAVRCWSTLSGSSSLKPGAEGSSTAALGDH